MYIYEFSLNKNFPSGMTMLSLPIDYNKNSNNRLEKHPFDFLVNAVQKTPQTLQGIVFGWLPEVEGKSLLQEICTLDPSWV